MKKQIFKIGIPLALLVAATLIIGSGCINNDPDYVDWYLDRDGDGYGTHEDVNYGPPSPQPNGYSLIDGDCDDTDANVNPDGTEIPDNEIDEDCNGKISLTRYVDNDEDGFGFGNAVVIEMELGGDYGNKYSTNNADCDDNNENINPLADEIMGNGIDDNCDGLTDEGVRYLDVDGDGYGSLNEAAAAGVFNNIDCDDDNPEVHPYAIEVEDGIDNDCDGLVDEN